MTTAHFGVQEHVLPTSYIREYARSTADDQEHELKLAVKQYTPLKAAQPGLRSVTIVGAHANGFPKELYEPLWDELYVRLEARGLHVCNVWIADAAHQGASGVLNEEQLGDDPSWMDHSRDLFLMINHFRKQMLRPLIGVGHSMGGCHLANLSLMHSRLFTTLILIDPVLMRHNPSEKGPPLAVISTRRRDLWPSRRAAESGFLKSKFYQNWDPRVLANWVRYGLRDLPTQIYPDTDTTQQHDVGVTLTTTKHQEVLSFMRRNFPTKDFPNPSIEPNPRTHPDVDPNIQPSSPFYRFEIHSTFHKLQFLRPSVLYLFADQSGISMPILIADKMTVTGTGAGGSGGVKKGRVKQITFKGIGHLIPMEIPNESAEACAGWIVPEIQRWAENEAQDRAEQAQVPRNLRSQMNENYVKTMLSGWYQQQGGQSAKPTKL